MSKFTNDYAIQNKYMKPYFAKADHFNRDGQAIFYAQLKFRLLVSCKMQKVNRQEYDVNLCALRRLAN